MKFFDAAAGCLPDACFERPVDAGIVLGSGWSGAIASGANPIARVNYADIAGLGAASVKGHAGEFILFESSGRRVAAWCGRRHRYEGAPWESVVMPVEMLRRMGCRRILLTNASGGINPALRPGDFVIVRDHINTSGENPLSGPHCAEWGERFPDMTEVYRRHLAERLHSCANRNGIRAMDGVYAYTSGPCYETPAEIQAYKAQGADVVGMSTVPEAVFAKACGLDVAGLSLVTNLAAGIARSPLKHEEVVAAAEAAKPAMALFIDCFTTAP